MTPDELTSETTKEAAEKAAERLNSRGCDVIVTTAELAK